MTNADCSRIKLEIALVFATILSFVGFGATTVTMTPGDNLAKLAEVGDDTTVVFPAGDYFLKGEVGVYTKKNLTLRGEKGARLVRSFDPSEPEKKVVLIFGWCENLTVEGFTVTTDNPVNTCGTVVSKTTKSFVVDVDEACPLSINGKPVKFASVDSYDANGMPDYNLADVADISYSVSGRRITVSHKPGNLTVGQRVCFRNAIYVDTTFYLLNTKNIVFRDLEVERTQSMAFQLQPNCENATFERVNVRLADGDKSCYAANADAIHIVGLAGRLTMTDCHFNGLGDDALNINTSAGKVTGWSSGTGTLTVKSRDGYSWMPGAYWCKAGSLLAVYGSDMKRKGGAEVVGYSFNDAGTGTVTVKNVDGSIATGDYIDVESARASVRISNCSVRNTRARGFLLQSKDMVVENCSFSQLALPGLLIAPDVANWFEMGPSSRVIVRNCTFTKCCANSGSAANTGALSVKVGHDSSGGGYAAGVHRDFAIYGNAFSNCSPRGLYLDSVNGAYVNNNTGADMKTVNCANVGTTFDKYVFSDGKLPVAADEPMTLDQPLGADITKTGAGTLTLDLPSGSSGRVNLAEGSMTVRPGSVDAVGTISSGTTLRIRPTSGYANVTLKNATFAGGDVVIDVPTGVTLTVPGTLAGSGRLTKAGEGTLILGSAGNVAIGLSAGTLSILDSSTSHLATIGGGSTLVYDGQQRTVVTDSFTGTAKNPVTVKIAAAATQTGSYPILSVPASAGAVTADSFRLECDKGVGLDAAVSVRTEGTMQVVSVDVSVKPHYILADDSFESFEPGTAADEIVGWSGEGSVAAQTVTMPDPPTYPLNGATHERTLSVDGTVLRTYADSFARDNPSVDMLFTVTSFETLPTSGEAEEGQQVAVAVDDDGWFNIWHPDAQGKGHWTPLSFGGSSEFADGAFVRLTLVFDYYSNADGVAYGQVRVNGSCGVLWDKALNRASAEGVRNPKNPVTNGSWFRLFESAAAGKTVSQLRIEGSAHVDDVVLGCHSTTALPSFDMGTVTGVDYVNRRVSGWIPFSTLDDVWGLPRDPHGDTDGDGFLDGDELLRGTNPLDAQSHLPYPTVIILR